MGYHLTDLGNAERLVEQHGEDMLYCAERKTWMVWDGKRYAPNNIRAMEKAAETARSIWDEVSSEARIPTDDSRKKDKRIAELAKHAARSESQQRINAILGCAEHMLDVSINEMDRNPYLLNCPNGTLDLRTGVLSPHCRTDRITRIANVNYNPDAHSELFEKFLLRIIPDNGERDYVQEVIGYSLFGGNPEEKFFYVWGRPAGGKSSLLSSIYHVLGDYAAVATPDTFVERRETGGVRQDLARLAGIRFVMSCEVAEGKKMAEEIVKTLAGGEPFTARFLYGLEFTFEPQFTLFFAANNVLRTTGGSAIYRRLVALPFNAAIPTQEQDPTIKAQLTTELAHMEAILKWAVDGCMNYFQRGRLPSSPISVETATKEYRYEADSIQAFIDECAELDPFGSVGVTELYERYKLWCDENGLKPVGSRKLKSLLKDYGVASGRTSSLRFYTGIALAQ